MDRFLIPFGIIVVVGSIACALLVALRQFGDFERISATITHVTIYPQKAGAGGAIIVYQYQYQGDSFIGQGPIGLSPQRKLTVGEPVEIYINTRYPENSFAGNPPRPLAWFASCFVSLIAGCAMIFDGYKKRYRTRACT